MAAGTFAGEQQGEITGAPQFVTDLGIEIWVSDLEDDPGSPYEFLAAVPAGAGTQIFSHNPVDPLTTRWYKLRYRTREGGISDFSAAKSGVTTGSLSGLDTDGDFTADVIGGGAGNQRIVIDNVNGILYFYDAADVEILRLGDNVIGTLDGVKLSAANSTVVSAVGTRTGNNSPIWLDEGTNNVATFLNQTIYVANSQLHAGNHNDIAGIKIIASTLGNGDAIALNVDAGSAGGDGVALQMVIADIIRWGTDTQLDRGAANILHTPDSFDVDGSYKMDGSDIIDTSGYQTGVLKTRQPLTFGYNNAITQTGVGVTTVDAKTVNGSENTQGYRMIRAGKVTGISLQFRGINAGTDAQLKATVQLNAANQAMTEGVVVAVSNNLGDDNTSNSFTFSAGDRINVELELEEVTGGNPSVEDIAVVVEFAA